MAPNKRRKKAKRSKAKSKRRTYAKRPAVRRKRKRVGGKRRLRANKRKASGRRRTLYSRKRTVTRRKRRGKGKLARGSVRIVTTRVVGRRRLTRRYSMKYKARRNSMGSILFVPPGSGKNGKRHRRIKLRANGSRFSRKLRRRSSFRRNGAFSPFLAALKAGAPVLGGLAGHRVLTGLLASFIAPSLPIPEAYKVPAIGVVVAAALAIGAKAAVKGQTGDLIGIGAAVSSLHQLVMAGLRAAGQDGAASYLAGIPTQRTTAYGMGAYELVGNGGGMSGFGADLPYAQALAGSPFAARGNYLAVPSLGALPYQQAAAGFGGGAFPEQAAAGFGAMAYPEQAAAGYGLASYELTGGVTLNGLGTSDAEAEAALDVADRQASVGFGDATIGRDNITIPDGAVSPVMDGTGLPMTAGMFGGNIFGVAY